MESFSDRIQALIDKHGRKELVEATRISSAQFQRLRKGSDTTRRNLLKLCQATGVRLEWLAAGTGSMYSSGHDAELSAHHDELSKDEWELVELFRKANLLQKMKTTQFLTSCDGPSGQQDQENEFID